MNKKLINWWVGSGVTHNSYVQGVLNASSDRPSAATLTALDNFFESISSLMSLAEMIKIYALNNASLTDFQLYNYVNPAANKSTLLSSPTYAVNGYVSAGAGSCVNENINTNRRAGVEDNFSTLVQVLASNTTDEANAAACGGTTTTGTNFILLRPKTGGAVGSFGYNATGFGFVTATKTGFLSLSSNGGAALKPRTGKDGSYSDSTISSVAPSGGPYSIYSCAWNFNNAVLNPLTTANVGFRWEGYELTDAQINTIRTALNTYLTAIGL